MNKNSTPINSKQHILPQTPITPQRNPFQTSSSSVLRSPSICKKLDFDQEYSDDNEYLDNDDNDILNIHHNSDKFSSPYDFKLTCNNLLKISLLYINLHHIKIYSLFIYKS